MISAILPIANFIKDFDNVAKIIKDTRNYDIELIIVNDSETAEVYKTKKLSNLGNQRLRIVRSEKGNPGGARNIGLKYATGDSVIFWDSDDQPDITKILQMSNNLLTSGDDFIIGGYTRIEKGFIKKYDAPRNKKLEIILNPGIWRIVFKKNSIINLKFSECNIGEDQLFMADVFDLNLKGSLFNENVYYYQKNQCSLTSSPKILENYEFTLKIIESQIGKKTRNTQLVYANLLLSYIKRSGRKNLKESIQKLINAINKYHLTFVILKILIVKMSSKWPL